MNGNAARCWSVKGFIQNRLGSASATHIYPSPLMSPVRDPHADCSTAFKPLARSTQCLFVQCGPLPAYVYQRLLGYAQVGKWIILFTEQNFKECRIWKVASSFHEALLFQSMRDTQFAQEQSHINSSQWKL